MERTPEYWYRVASHLGDEATQQAFTVEGNHRACELHDAAAIAFALAGGPRHIRRRLEGGKLWPYPTPKSQAGTPSRRPA